MATSDSIQQVSLRVANLDCENEAAILERALHQLPGVVEVTIYPRSARVAVQFKPQQLSAKALRQQLEALGFPPVGQWEMPTVPRPWKNPKVVLSVASGVMLVLGWLLEAVIGATELSTAAYWLAIGLGGYYFGKEALEKLLLRRQVGIELLMSVAAVVALLSGLPAEGAMLAFLYSLSEAAEGYTEEKTRFAIKALVNLVPRTATVKRNGQEMTIPVEEIRIGDVLIVKPGETIPTDGTVISGNSSVNEAPITGESMPVDKQPGATVLAGSINGQGLLEIRATRAFADNTLSRIIQLVEEAQERKGRTERWIERFGRRYSPAVLAIGVVLATVPPLLWDASWHTWIVRATVFIVAAAPCALVMAIPITMVATLGNAARQGILIKGGVYVEELARVRVVALDKTGTLTRGEPRVTDLEVVAPGWDSRKFLELVASLESGSEHPLARAIVHHARNLGVAVVRPEAFETLPGSGIRARFNGEVYWAGNPALLQSRGVAISDAVKTTIQHWEAQGKTVVLVAGENHLLGLLALRDELRPDAAATVQALRQLGIRHIAMLTGDNSQTARAIAQQLSIDQVFAELKPADKAHIVQQLTRQYGHVAMVGDGINDAPALAHATVGIAMGAAGTDVAMETADVVLMADDLHKLVSAFQLAHRNQTIVRQNVGLSVVVIGSLAIGAIAGWFTLPVAVLAHEISEFLVIGNGLRMVKK